MRSNPQVGLDRVHLAMRALLASGKTDSTTQAAIFRYASECGDHGLLAELAGHPGLVAEIDEALAKIPAVTVRAAWLSRPGRGSSEISESLRSEKRSTVLMALAGITGLPAAIREHLAEIAYERRLRSLAAALLLPTLDSDAVSAPTRYLLSRLVFDVEAGSIRSGLYSQVILRVDDPPVAAGALEVSSNVRVLHQALRTVNVAESVTTLPEEALNRIFFKVVAPAVRLAALTHEWRQPEGPEIAAILAFLAFSEKTKNFDRSQIRELLSCEGVFDALYKLHSPESSLLLSYGDKTLDDLVEAARTADSATASVYLTFSMALASPELFAAAIENSAVDGSAVLRYSRYPGARFIQRVLDLATTKETRGLVAAQFNRYFYDSSVGAASVLADPYQVSRALCEAGGSFGHGFPGHLVLALLRQGYLSELDALGLPVKLFDQGNGKLSAEIMKVCSTVLANTPTAWDVFLVLLPEADRSTLICDLLDGALLSSGSAESCRELLAAAA